MVYLYLILRLFSISPLSLFFPRYGVWTWGERVMWIREGKVNDNYWIIQPRREDWYKVQTQFSTLSTLFPSCFLIVSLSLIRTLFYLFPSPLFLPRDGVWNIGERVLRKRWGKGNDNYWVIESVSGLCTMSFHYPLRCLPSFYISLERCVCGIGSWDRTLYPSPRRDSITQ